MVLLSFGSCCEINDQIWLIVQDVYCIPRTYTIFHPKYFQLEVDHIIAVSLGGEMWDKKNLRVLCSDCHKVKTREDMKKLKIQRKQEENQTLENTFDLKEKVDSGNSQMGLQNKKEVI